MKKLFLAVFIVSTVLVGVLGGFAYLVMKFGKATISDPKNIQYALDGQVFAMENGLAEKQATPGSATKIILRMFGEPVYGDLDKDGDDDAAVLLAYDPGGSGVFYYAALAMKNNETYQATNAMFLGDRIAPQTINILEGRAVYNFAERKPGEPMSVQPSVGKSVWVHYDKANNQIGEWVKDFEGESAIGITESEARSIAEKTCIKGGEFLAAGQHNKNTQTWWFDANLNSKPEGCNPACVVDEKTRIAEINWRCTGLRP